MRLCRIVLPAGGTLSSSVRPVSALRQQLRPCLAPVPPPRCCCCWWCCCFCVRFCRCSWRWVNDRRISTDRGPALRAISWRVTNASEHKKRQHKATVVAAAVCSVMPLYAVCLLLPCSTVQQYVSHARLELTRTQQQHIEEQRNCAASVSK